MIKKLVKILLSRTAIVVALIAIQALLVATLIVFLSETSLYTFFGLQILSIFVVIWLVTNNDNPSYKLAWVIPILSLPLFGGLFYMLWGYNKIPKNMRERMKNFYKEVKNIDAHGIELKDEITEQSLLRQADYIQNVSGFGVWKNTYADYYPSGESFFVAFKQELRKAQHYIFMEYFIFQPGKMWDEILAILVKKVKDGVDVRIMYDDVGCIGTLPKNYTKTLGDLGIKAIVFNPFVPRMSLMLNYRDHRKICVIDGNTGFTGGINLADEYINAYAKHGHWKDTAVILKGDGVWNLTLMFFHLWNFSTNEYLDPKLYRPNKSYNTDGYVQPFGDSPLDRINVSENAYLQMISRAKKYVYITSPYLIIDNEMVTALTIAAQSGVDVRIITPYHADKWFVHFVTQSYYRVLVESGVKIYEYTPGFIHAKMFVADDDVAIVGTANMDYRSFYMHFECGVSFYQSSVVYKVKKDIKNTLESCQQIFLTDLEKISWGKKTIQSILRIFAPLM